MTEARALAFGGGAAGRAAVVPPSAPQIGARPATPYGQPRSRFPASVRLSFYVFVLAIPFESLDLGFMTGYLSIAKVTGALFFAFCLWYRSICFPRPARPIWWFAGYWLIIVLYTFILPRSMVREQITTDVTIAQLILFLWVGSVLLQESQIMRNVLVCFLVSCSVLSVGNVLKIPGFVDEIGDRWSGYRYSALGYALNELGALLALALLVGVGLVLDRARWKGWKRTLLLVAMAPIPIVMVRTGSRGALLAFVLAVGWYMLPIGRKGRRVVAIVIGAGALAGVIVMVIRDPDTLQRFTKSVKEGDTAGRDIIFEFAKDMFFEKPLFGWGPTAYLYELGYRTRHIQKDPHNLYLGLLAEVGIVGILPFLRGLWLCTHAAWRARVGVFGVMPLVLVTMSLLANLSGHWIARKTMWLILAIAIGAALGAQTPALSRPPANGRRFPLAPPS